MKKGLIKKKISFGLSMAAVGILLGGTAFAVKNVNAMSNAEKSRKQLLNQYTTTQEYKDACEREMKEFFDADSTRTKFEYNVKSILLTRDNFIEQTIFEGKDIELQNKLIKLNEEIELAQLQSGLGFASGAVGGLAMIAGSEALKKRAQEEIESDE